MGSYCLRTVEFLFGMMKRFWKQWGWYNIVNVLNNTKLYTWEWLLKKDKKKECMKERQEQKKKDDRNRIQEQNGKLNWPYQQLVKI